MLVWILASQRLDPVRPEDGEHSETTPEASEWSDQSNLGGGPAILGGPDNPARSCCQYATWRDRNHVSRHFVYFSVGTTMLRQIKPTLTYCAQCPMYLDITG
jgi:hypothetical protein